MLPLTSCWKVAMTEYLENDVSMTMPPGCSMITAPRMAVHPVSMTECVYLI